MKKIFVLAAFILLCQMTAWSIDLKYDGTSKESILELDFSEGAKANDAYISWNLVGDWDKFSYSFSQGKVKGGVFTIKASEYLDRVDDLDGIGLTLEGKSKTRTGNYELSMIVNEVSKDMGFMAEDLELDIPVNYTGKPIWLLFLVPAIILIALVLLLILVLHVTAKFPRGLLQLNNNTVKLQGKKMISVKDELQKMGVFLADGTEIILVKKRFASFQGPCVKEATNCNLKCNGAPLTKGKIMHRNQVVTGLTDKSGTPISMRYC